MRTKHTPKPWRAARWANSRCVDGVEFVVVDSRGHGLFTSCAKGNNAKASANTLLAAAAPDMLEVLTKVVAFLDIERSIDADELAGGNIHDAAIAAIAKATACHPAPHPLTERTER